MAKPKILFNNKTKKFLRQEGPYLDSISFEIEVERGTSDWLWGSAMLKISDGEKTCNFSVEIDDDRNYIKDISAIQALIKELASFRINCDLARRAYLEEVARKAEEEAEEKEKEKKKVQVKKVVKKTTKK